MRDQAAECRRIAKEVEIGKGAVGDLFKAYVAAQQAADDVLPSEWIAFSTRAADAAAGLRCAQIKRDGAASSTAKLECKLMGLRSALRIHNQNFKNVLNNLIVRADPDAPAQDYADDLHRVGVIAGEPADSAEALVKLTEEFGAQLPEGME